MRRSLFLKFIVIGGLILILLIPIALIRGVISEREWRRDGVAQDIASSWTAQQTITGVVLVVPYNRTVTREKDIYINDKRQTVKRDHIESHTHYIVADTLRIDGALTTEERARGIYTVPVYTTRVHMEGTFTIPQNAGLTHNLDRVRFKEPYLVIGVQDIRGLHGIASVTVNGAEVPLTPGTETPVLRQGVHAVLPGHDFTADRTHTFTAEFGLNGMFNLSFRPVAKNATVALTSPWPHPSFDGRFLPTSHDISDAGFTAQWDTSFFATNIEHELTACGVRNECDAFRGNIFGVTLNAGVDVYQQAERSLKYALLFVGLTFVVFFLFEILKDLRIHAVQYGLVGIALAIFYLLLISLSEHIDFYSAYMIASAACVGLLAFYVSYVLNSAIRGLGFAVILAGLYGALFFLIQSEDHALLLGSLLIFCVLAVLMALTRKVDWYKIEADAKDIIHPPTIRGSELEINP